MIKRPWNSSRTFSIYCLFGVSCDAFLFSPNHYFSSGRSSQSFRFGTVTSSVCGSLSWSSLSSNRIFWLPTVVDYPQSDLKNHVKTIPVTWSPFNYESSNLKVKSISQYVQTIQQHLNVFANCMKDSFSISTLPDVHGVLDDPERGVSTTDPVHVNI